VPDKFQDFIDSTSWKSYFVAPSVDYGFDGVPYLSISLDIHVIAETEVWLKPGKKKFEGSSI